MLGPGQLLTGETIAVLGRVLVARVDDVATAPDFELDDPIETAIPLPDDLFAQFRDDLLQFLRIRIMESAGEPVQAPAERATGRPAQGFQG